MGRKKEEINPKSGERLKKVISESGMTQSQFADWLGYTEQHLSLIVTGKRRLTPETAQRIAEEYPPIQRDWLMGYSKYRTNAERAKAQLQKCMDEAEALYEPMKLLAGLHGYEFEQTLHGNNSVEKWIKAIEQFYTVRKDGEIIGTCSAEQYNRLANLIYKLAGSVFENFECEVK